MNTPTALADRTDERPHQRLPELPPLSDHPGKNRWWLWLLVFGLIGYGCYRLYLFENAKQAAATAKKDAAKSGARKVLVVAAAARSGNVPVYLRGLGSVTPFNTVIVKSRVDGQLTSVNFREGQFVHQGDVLAEIDPRPFQVALDQANGNLEKDTAALKDVQVNLERDRALFNEKIIARQQLDTQAASVGQAKGSLVGDQAGIDSAKLNLTFTKILAPISGRIGLRQLDSGNMIHASDATGIATIAQIQPIAVLFSLPQDDLPKVLPKLRASQKLRAEAYDRDQVTKLAVGALLTVDNQIDQTTGTSRLKAVFDNKDNSLFPNQFVNIKLLLGTDTGVIIPAVGVQRGPNGTFVYLINQNNKAVVRNIKIGLAEGNEVVVESGLAAGERIVVDGADRLTEGMEVSIQSSNGVRNSTSPNGKTSASPNGTKTSSSPAGDSRTGGSRGKQ